MSRERSEPAQTRMPVRTLSFTQRQVDYLESTAKDLGVTVGELVRRIIDRYMELQAASPVARGGAP